MREPIDPTPPQFAAFSAADRSAPICMVNLLKFREKAEYDDRRDAGGISGAEAYNLYGAVAARKIAEVGGKILWGSPAEMTFIGDGRDDRDVVIVVYYPSHQAFLTMVAEPDYQEASPHRHAGLARTAIIKCAGNANFGARS